MPGDPKYAAKDNATGASANQLQGVVRYTPIHPRKYSSQKRGPAQHVADQEKSIERVVLCFRQTQKFPRFRDWVLKLITP